MKLDDFKRELNQLMQRQTFQPLLEDLVYEQGKVWKYLIQRGFQPETISGLECYFYNGHFVYQGKNYYLDDSVVFPLRDKNKKLRGVWIRALQDKQFYIWLVNEDTQKYWLDIKDPNEPVYLAESIFDAISLREIFKVANIGACLGVKPSNDLIESLKDHEVILALDQDSAGYRGMLSCLENEKTSNWKVLEPVNESIDISSIKDYNDILRLRISDVSFKLKQSIQAKIWLKSKL